MTINNLIRHYDRQRRFLDLLFCVSQHPHKPVVHFLYIKLSLLVSSKEAAAILVEHNFGVVKFALRSRLFEINCLMIEDSRLVSCTIKEIQVFLSDFLVLYEDDVVHIYYLPSFVVF